MKGSTSSSLGVYSKIVISRSLRVKVMLDDHARVHRLREEPRTDIPLAHRVQRFVEALQHHICKAIEDVDGAAQFRRDPWNYREGGGIDLCAGKRRCL